MDEQDNRDEQERQDEPKGGNRRKRKNGVKLDDEMTREGQAIFLAHFRNNGIVRDAAEAAGVSRQTVDTWRKRAEFRKRFEEAEQEAADLIFREVRRRAIDGVPEPMVSHGELVYYQLPVIDEATGEQALDRWGRPMWKRGDIFTVQRYSDMLLKLLATARVPGLVPVARKELTGKDGGAIKTETAARVLFVVPEREPLDDGSDEEEDETEDEAAESDG